MRFELIFAIAFDIASRCTAEVEFEEGVSQVIFYKDDIMHLFVYNENHKSGNISVCFEASPETLTPRCPEGYAELYVSIKRSQKVLTFDITRDSRILDDVDNVIEGELQFRDDGSIEVVVEEQPDLITVSIANAHVFDPKKSVEITRQKCKKRLYWIIFGVCVVAVLMIIGFTVGICCCYKRRTRTHTLTEENQSVLPQNDKPSVSGPSVSGPSMSTKAATPEEQVQLLSVKPYSPAFNG
uniref:Uncharacterized protein n=1 Tax=Panagrellus redivivus TaxID=6233 RepID=A0A7E4WC87_PANRE